MEISEIKFTPMLALNCSERFFHMPSVSYVAYAGLCDTCGYSAGPAMNSLEEISFSTAEIWKSLELECEMCKFAICAISCNILIINEKTVSN